MRHLAYFVDSDEVKQTLDTETLEMTLTHEPSDYPGIKHVLKAFSVLRFRNMKSYGIVLPGKSNEGFIYDYHSFTMLHPILSRSLNELHVWSPR